MENKINIAELLKDCPKGMELDCTIFGTKVIYQKIYKIAPFPIVVQTEHGFEFRLTQCGQIHNIVGAECVIFPKGKTTWEGFVPPCKFKNGDVCYVKTKTLFEYIFIFRVSENHVDIGCYVTLSAYNELYTDISYVCVTDSIKEIRLATEEEKQKLFDAIKANGFKWNVETKTLKKLISPKFEVGDRIKKKKSYISGIITDINDGTYKVEYKSGGVSYANIKFQEDWELVPDKFDITTLKPFKSKVLVRSFDGDVWRPAIYGFTDSNKYYIVGGVYWKQCIPYKGNRHLLGTTNDCDEYYKTW